LFFFSLSISAPSAQVAEGQMRIGRPRQLYVGPKQRTWRDAKVRKCLGFDGHLM
jgi:hypothetical protein